VLVEAAGCTKCNEIGHRRFEDAMIRHARRHRKTKLTCDALQSRENARRAAAKKSCDHLIRLIETSHDDGDMIAAAS